MRRIVLVLAAGAAAIVPGIAGRRHRAARWRVPGSPSSGPRRRPPRPSTSRRRSAKAAATSPARRPPRTAAGVVFYCYGVNSGGAPLVAQATINDYGTAEISPSVAAMRRRRRTAPTTTSPVVSSAQGTGSQVVQVDPISGPTIVAVTHDGDGAFAVQPQQGGVPVGRRWRPSPETVVGSLPRRSRRDDLRLRRHRRRRLDAHRRAAQRRPDVRPDGGGDRREPRCRRLRRRRAVDGRPSPTTAPGRSSSRAVTAVRRAGVGQPGRTVHRDRRGARRPGLRHGRRPRQLVAATPDLTPLRPSGRSSFRCRPGAPQPVDSDPDGGGPGTLSTPLGL